MTVEKPMSYREYLTLLQRHWPSALLERTANYVRFRHSEDSPFIYVTPLPDGTFKESQ